MQCDRSGLRYSLWQVTGRQCVQGFRVLLQVVSGDKIGEDEDEHAKQAGLQVYSHTKCSTFIQMSLAA